MADKIINASGNCNYISGNKVFILDIINDKTCAELIGNLSNMVDDMPWAPDGQIPAMGGGIKNPYILPDNAPSVVDVYINSPGGEVCTYRSIMTLLNLARAKGAIIRTTVMGAASSCASLIAVQGTPNFRIMYEESYNMIHYGKSKLSVDKINEIDNAQIYETINRNKLFEPYLKYTGLTKRELTQLQKTEYGHKFADECLQKKICDWILTSDGKFIHR